MSINNEAGMARQFVAAREVFSTSWINGTKVWQAVYTVFFVGFVGFAVLMMYNTSQGAKTHIPRYTGVIFIAVLLGAGAVIGVYMFWRSRQKYVLTVTGDAAWASARSAKVSPAQNESFKNRTLRSTRALSCGARTLAGSTKNPQVTRPLPGLTCRRSVPSVFITYI